MNFKIFSAKRALVEQTDDTGTYPDGMFTELVMDASRSRKEIYSSSHERDYGAARKVTEIPLGFV